MSDRPTQAASSDASPPTRWTLSVSRETDVALRTHLAQRGMKKGDLSRFVEDAVRWRVLRETAAEAREAFAGLPPDEVEALADEAVAWARKGGGGRDG